MDDDDNDDDDDDDGDEEEETEGHRHPSHYRIWPNRSLGLELRQWKTPQPFAERLTEWGIVAQSKMDKTVLVHMVARIGQ